MEAGSWNPDVPRLLGTKKHRDRAGSWNPDVPRIIGTKKLSRCIIPEVPRRKAGTKKLREQAGQGWKLVEEFGILNSEFRRNKVSLGDM